MARTEAAWQKIGTYIEPIEPNGVDILVKGSNKYINFGSVVGSSGYGFRDNAGNIEFKDSGGSWGDLGAGGGGGVGTSGTPVANDFARFTNANTIEGRSYAEVRGDLDLEIGTDVQAWSALLDALAALTPGVEGRMITSDGLGGYQISTVGAVRTYLNVEDGATADQSDAEILAAVESESGRDMSVDGSKLDGIEAGADVTDATNVAAAGAVMKTQNKTYSFVMYSAEDSTTYELPYILDVATTITRIEAKTDTGTFPLTFKQGATDILSSALTATDTGASSTSFNDATVPARTDMSVVTGTSTGSPTSVSVVIEYTID